MANTVDASDVLLGTGGNDVLVGGRGDDLLFGFGGNDVLNGRQGSNTLHGGSGDDIYQLRNKTADNSIVEEADRGTDTVLSWFSYTLSPHVENLELRSAVNWQYGRGNALKNIITAGAGPQSLDGLGGDDVLAGGTGRDTFNFGVDSGNDRITDFEPGRDRILVWGPEIRSYEDVLARLETMGDDVRLELGPNRSVLIQHTHAADLDPETFGLASLPADMNPTFADEFDTFDPSLDGPWSRGSGRGNPHDLLYSGSPDTEQVYVNPDYPGAGDVPLGLNPFSLSDGILTISAKRAPDSLVPDLFGKQWISGRLTSHETFEQRYGYFEMRAKLPAGQGFWPAFWLAPSDHSWPPEIDVFEMLGKEPFVIRNSVSSEYWGFQVAQGQYSLVPDTSASFHTYGILWSPQTVSFLFDGRTLFSLPTPQDLHRPMAIIANLAVGGNWGGATDATTPDRGAFEIDYIRAYDVPSLENLPRATGPTEMVDSVNGILRRGVAKPIAVYGDDVVRLEGTRPHYVTKRGETVVGNTLGNRLTGDELGNTLNGLAGDDVLRGRSGDDILLGEAGSDDLTGGPGLDHLAGGPGNDSYEFGWGDFGAAPNEEIILERIDEGRDTIRLVGGILPESIRMWIESARLHVAIDNTQYLSVKLTVDKHGHHIGDHVERIVFGDGTRWSLTAGLRLSDTDDSHSSSGSGAGDLLLGNGGDDRLAGLDGNDTLDGGEGRDVLFGGDGGDRLSDAGHGSDDSLDGEAGNDTARGGAGFDRLHGGSGADRLTASADGDYLEGGAGADELVGGAGRDLFVFGRDAAGTGVDKIRGFQDGVDAIGLVVAAFNVTGELRDEWFEMGPSATAPDSRLHFDPSSRTLHYDPDGSGARVKVALATLGPDAVLGPHSFDLI